jgi:hypothetical protein
MGKGTNVPTNEGEPGFGRRAVETRASGRPPEEAESDDPEEQARAILEDSEDRMKEGAGPSADGEA